jgi:hypothetical protein
MRDGRLGGAQRASFERHAETCAACAREVRALEELARALREGVGAEAGVDELRVRRERTRLLAAFDRALVGPERRERAGRGVLLRAAVVLALAAGVLVLWRVRRGAHTAVAGAAAGSAVAVVHAEGAAVWSERTEGDREAVVLERGALSVHVEHPAGGRRLVVVLPDGELEDSGTTFTVSVQDGRTTRVAVQEGSVVLRLRGEAPVAIGAGGAWIAEERVAVAAPAATASVDVPARPTASAPPSLQARNTAPSASLPTPPAAGPSTDFRAAVTALEGGDDRDAAARFERFLAEHPRDPRAEDAAYLRVIALQRCGDGAGVKEAARGYLRRYPAGFRRAEMESLAELPAGGATRP